VARTLRRAGDVSRKPGRDVYHVVVSWSLCSVRRRVDLASLERTQARDNVESRDRYLMCHMTLIIAIPNSHPIKRAQQTELRHTFVKSMQRSSTKSATHAFIPTHYAYQYLPFLR
jgi:hypothetical protein